MHKNQSAFLSLFLFILVCVPHQLSAEAIYLKNGQVIYGRIVNQNRAEVRIITDQGMRVIPKSTIGRIDYGATKI